jgi:hypothetical protein
MRASRLLVPFHIDLSIADGTDLFIFHIWRRYVLNRSSLRIFRARRANLFIRRQYKILAKGKPRPCCRHLTES